VFSKPRRVFKLNTMRGLVRFSPVVECGLSACFAVVSCCNRLRRPMQSPIMLRVRRAVTVVSQSRLVLLGVLDSEHSN
jgi:hypothetical protein